MHEQVDYPEFLRRLNSVLASQETATLRVVTDDRHFINIGVERGQIVAVYHGPRRGLPALDLILKMTSGSLSVLSTHEFETQSNLPPTSEILHFLKQGELEQLRDSGHSQGSNGDQEQPHQAATAEFTAAIHHIEQTLLHYIGPIAGMLVQDTIEDMGGLSNTNDLIRLTNILSNEIDPPAKSQQFVDQALKYA